MKETQRHFLSAKNSFLFLPRNRTSSGCEGEVSLGRSGTMSWVPVCIAVATFVPAVRIPVQQHPVVWPTLLMADEPLGYKIVKGKRVALDSSGFDAARTGECIEPVDPVVGLTVLGVAALVASVGFNTARNRADSVLEGGDANVPRRRALTWLGLQVGAAFYIGPELTNPCSNINSDDRWAGSS